MAEAGRGVSTPSLKGKAVAKMVILPLEKPLVRVGLALLSSVFVTLSFPGPDLGWLAWIALAPLLLAVRGSRPLPAFSLGMLSGAAAAFGVYHWMFQLPKFGLHHAAVMAAYLALYPAVWCLAVSRLATRPLSLLLTAPALWVALEYLRAHAGFLALPWATLAHSQHENIAVLQLASVTGEHGITFLVVMVNAAFADLVFRRRVSGPAWAAAAAAAAVHVAGFLALGSAYPGAGGGTVDNGRRVAVIQPSLLYEETRGREGDRLRWERLEDLTRQAAARDPELVVWPESAVRNSSVDGGGLLRLQGLAADTGIPILAGVSDSEKFVAEDNEKPETRLFNAAYLVDPDRGASEPYRKNLLVPFGEYLPLADSFPWPGWLVPETGRVERGRLRRLFSLDDGRRVATLICWENLFPGYVRKMVKSGADLLVHISNNGWFGDSAQPRQHNTASVLRAVENGISVVVASNTGPSQLVDPRGRVVAQAKGQFTRETVAGRVPMGRGGTLYARFGDSPVLLFCAGMLLIGAGSYARRRLPARNPGESRVALGKAYP